jgi:hypothetical protein
MNIRVYMLATAAASSLIAGTAQAAPAKKHHAHAASANQQLLEEVKALRAEVEGLKEKVNAQDTAQATTQQQIESAQTQAQAASSEAQAVQAQVQAANAAPPVTKEQVNSQIASAIDKEHHNDKFYFKGITITPGGFLELAGIYRSRFQGDDIASSFNVPFPSQSRQSHTSEGRFSARQSRVSFLAQGKANEATTLAMYGEFDFQGAAQTSNSNQSNSYVPRIRNLYTTIDWNNGDYGLHFLAGQNWSLLTMQGKGMTPRSEVTPPQVDAQYIPGFAWARQPGIRLVGDFADHHLWIGLSAENPQTTFGGTAAPANVTSVLAGQGPATPPAGSSATNPPGAFQQFYNGFGSSLSLNHMPDFIGKVAYETAVGGHNLHVEGFAINRTFTEHFNGTSVVEGSNDSVNTWGYGGSVNFQVVPKMLDAQFSYFGGRGIGRYGSAGLPDVTFNAAGDLRPIRENMLLAGLTLHATKKLDVYGFAGEEVEQRLLLSNGLDGLGLFSANNSGCLVEGGTCSGNTHAIRQLTGGFWDKMYEGSFGRFQAGIQYSYTQRELFSGVGGAPKADNNMVFLSFRYYPF